jgi:hypothetical protein
MSDTAISARALGGPRAESLVRPAIAGAVGALAGIGLSELVAGFLGGPSLLAAIGEVVIDNQPPGAKDFVVGLFGTNDKLALEILIVALAAIVGAGLGILAARRTLAVASVGFGAFAIAGFFAALRSPAASPTTAMIVALVAGVASVQVLSLLLGPTGAARIATGNSTPVAAPDWSRRVFLIQAGAVAVASTVAGVVGRRLPARS